MMGFDVNSEAQTAALELTAKVSDKPPHPSTRPLSVVATPTVTRTEDKRITTTTFSDQETVTVTKKKVVGLGPSTISLGGGTSTPGGGRNAPRAMNTPVGRCAPPGGSTPGGGGSIYNLIKKQMGGGVSQSPGQVWRTTRKLISLVLKYFHINIYIYFSHMMTDNYYYCLRIIK